MKLTPVKAHILKQVIQWKPKKEESGQEQPLFKTNLPLDLQHSRPYYEFDRDSSQTLVAFDTNWHHNQVSLERSTGLRFRKLFVSVEEKLKNKETGGEGGSIFHQWDFTLINHYITAKIQRKLERAIQEIKTPETLDHDHENENVFIFQELLFLINEIQESKHDQKDEKGTQEFQEFGLSYLTCRHQMLQDPPKNSFILPDVAFRIYNEKEFLQHFPASTPDWCPFHRLTFKVLPNIDIVSIFKSNKDYEGARLDFRTYKNGIHKECWLSKRTERTLEEKKIIKSCKRFLYKKYKVSEIIETEPNNDQWWEFVIQKGKKFCMVSQMYDNASCAGKQLYFGTTQWHDSLSILWNSLENHRKADFVKELFYPVIQTRFKESKPGIWDSDSDSDSDFE
jgi:hypothetical protein